MIFCKKLIFVKKKQINQLFDGRIVSENNEGKWLEFRIQPFQKGVLIMSLEISKPIKKNERRPIHSQSLLKSRTIELAETLERECNLSRKKKSLLSKNAHDLKTPLGLIKLSVNVLKKMNENSDTEEVEKYHANIEEEIDKLYHLIDQFIKPIKKEIGGELFDFKSFNIFLFLKETIHDFQMIYGIVPEIHLECKGDGMVCLDKKILEYLLSNILRTISNYSKEKILIKLCVENRRILLEIIVEGIYLSIQKQKELFGLFLKEDTFQKELEGTLELSIAKYYVELMDGIIRVKIGKENSTTFTIMLPIQN